MYFLKKFIRKLTNIKHKKLLIITIIIILLSMLGNSNVFAADEDLLCNCNTDSLPSINRRSCSLNAYNPSGTGDYCSAITPGYFNFTDEGYIGNSSSLPLFLKLGDTEHSRFTLDIYSSDITYPSYFYNLLPQGLAFDLESNSKYEFERVYKINKKDYVYSFSSRDTWYLDNDVLSFRIAYENAEHELLYGNFKPDDFSDASYLPLSLYFKKVFVFAKTEENDDGYFLKVYLQLETNDIGDSVREINVEFPNVAEFYNSNSKFPFMLSTNSRPIYYGYINKKVDSFSVLPDEPGSSGGSHGGSGIDLDTGETMDKENNHDTEIFDTLKICDTLDVGCHLENLVILIKRFFTRAGNFFVDIISRVVNGFINIGDGLLKLGKFIVDGLSNTFSYTFGFDGSYLQDRFTELRNLFTDKFGILLFPFTFIYDIFDRFYGLPENVINSISFPGIQLFGKNLIPSFEFNLSTFNGFSVVSNIYHFYLLFVNFFIGICIYRLAYTKINNIFGGGNYDS